MGKGRYTEYYPYTGIVRAARLPFHRKNHDEERAVDEYAI